jgi:CubicO group peptidase (beta-lactamase class C family)
MVKIAVPTLTARRAAFLLAAIASTSAFGALDEALLGKAEGYPVCPLTQGPTEPRCLVGILSHFDEVAPAHKVAKPAAPRLLKRAAKEPAISYTFGEAYTFREQPGGTIDSFLQRSRNTGLLVMQGDTILVERYQYDRKPEHRFQSYSMAKTVVGMLVGIALAEKKIDSIDDPAEKYVPALKGHPYGETSLRHLLAMSSGVKFSENYDGRDDVSVLNRKTVYQQGPGGVDTVSTFTQRERPAGERFHYASGDSEVLGLVLRAAVGKPLAEYLSEKIWQPMGAEADASWLTDAGGFETGYMGINATLRDWGRLGMLLANDGELDGKQIIPAEWVKAATVAQAPHGQGVAYGYQTWIIRPAERMFALLGVRGQAVMVDPKTKVVVVHTAAHGRPANDPLRSEQYALFFGVVNSLRIKQQPR